MSVKKPSDDSGEKQDIYPWNALVGCFDLLGTSQRFRDDCTIGDEIHEALRLHKAVSRIREILNNSGQNGKVQWDSYTSALFSDSVFLIRKLMAQPDDGELDFTCVLDDISACQTELLKAGYVCRGGLDFGRVFFENNFCCGSGLVSAHNMDKHGQAPFVFVPQRAIKRMYGMACRMKAQQSIDDFFLLDPEWRNSLLYLPYEGQFILNYMKDWPFGDSLKELLDMQRQLILDNLLRFSGGGNTHKKYEMLRRFHNHVLTLWGESRLFDQYCIKEVDVLPVFESADSAVQAIVDECDRSVKHLKENARQ